jgi:hypothetical protein
MTDFNAPDQVLMAGGVLRRLKWTSIRVPLPALGHIAPAWRS